VSAEQYPPSEFGADGSGGNAWKYSSKSACALYGQQNLQKCTPRNRVNERDPQELFNVTGASVDKSWEVSSGRPDVVIGVVDSGIEWDDVDAMRDLNNKTFLNAGELPEPDWGTRDPRHPHDRDANGIFDIRDYCPGWADAAPDGAVRLARRPGLRRRGRLARARRRRHRRHRPEQERHHRPRGPHLPVLRRRGRRRQRLRRRHQRLGHLRGRQRPLRRPLVRARHRRGP
jgi:hypothetical protein